MIYTKSFLYLCEKDFNLNRYGKICQLFKLNKLNNRAEEKNHYYIYIENYQSFTTNQYEKVYLRNTPKNPEIYKKEKIETLVPFY